MNRICPTRAGVVLATGLMLAACTRSDRPPETAATPKHEHHPPHAGTPVVLGEELYHLEFVRDPAAGTLEAFVLDGEMENFIRCRAPAITITARLGGLTRPLILSAVANPATGETVGDTSCFEGRAGWLKAAPQFDAEIGSITVRGTTFTGVRFNFPRGNDPD